MRLGMLALVGCVATLGATQPQQLDLTKLRILDDEGKPRFAMGTLPDATARIEAYDHNEKKRFMLRTTDDGGARIDAASGEDGV
jgi:hypothetical protein